MPHCSPHQREHAERQSHGLREGLSHVLVLGGVAPTAEEAESAPALVPPGCVTGRGARLGGRRFAVQARRGGRRQDPGLSPRLSPREQAADPSRGGLHYRGAGPPAAAVPPSGPAVQARPHPPLRTPPSVHQETFPR